MRSLFKNRGPRGPSPRDIRRAIKIARREPGIMRRAVLVGKIADRWDVLAEWVPDGRLHVLSRVYLAKRPLSSGDAYAFQPIDMHDPITYKGHGTVRLAYVCSHAPGEMPGLAVQK